MKKEKFSVKYTLEIDMIKNLLEEIKKGNGSINKANEVYSRFNQLISKADAEEDGNIEIIASTLNENRNIN